MYWTEERIQKVRKVCKRVDNTMDAVVALRKQGIIVNVQNLQHYLYLWDVDHDFKRGGARQGSGRSKKYDRSADSYR